MAYLGTDQPSLNLNFSKNANMVVAQYYQFLRLGFEGYRKIMNNLMKVSGHLAEGVLATGGATTLSHKDASLDGPPARADMVPCGKYMPCKRALAYASRSLQGRVGVVLS